MRGLSGRHSKRFPGAEVSPPAKPLYQHWAFWAAFALLAVFPAACVSSASTATRFGWAIIVSMVFVLIFAIHAGIRKDPKAQLTRPYSRRPLPVSRTIIVGAPVLALTLSVAATYALPERPVLWQMTVLIAQLGSTVFPVVGKFATHIVPPLTPVTLYKAQSVVTLFMLAGFALATAIIWLALFMPSEERRAVREATEKYANRVRSPAMRWFCIALAVIFGLAVFFGWFGFTPKPKDMLGARCLATAACYVQNDILLLAGAFFVTFMTFGIWSGAFSMLRNAVSSDNDSS